MVDIAFYIPWIAFTIFLAIAVHFYLSVKQQRSKRHVKITVKFMAVKDDEIEGKGNFYKLLVAVIQNHPQVLQNAHQNQRVEIVIAGETIYIALSEESAEVIDLNHVVDHVRYCIQTITEDTANCIKLMKHPPGPNFQTSITTLRLALPNNAKLVIISDPPIQTNTNLVIWPSGYTPQEWMERYKTSNSVILTVKDYEDILERKGLDGILKTKKENIRRMLKLNMINPGDGLYLVRTKCGMTYAHVAVVTDAKFMNFVHVSKKPSLPFFGEYGTIVEGHFEKVVKEEDKCFIVRHRHKELTGQNIADRARTFALPPALTFTYNVINANCEVAFNAAAGIFQEGRGSLQGQLVQEPYYDRVKRTFGLALEKLQKSPESELLEKLHFKLLTNGMLREAAQGHPVEQPVAEMESVEPGLTSSPRATPVASSSRVTPVASSSRVTVEQPVAEMESVEPGLTSSPRVTQVASSSRVTVEQPVAEMESVEPGLTSSPRVTQVASSSRVTDYILSSTGRAAEYQGDKLGIYREIEGSAYGYSRVYQQAGGPNFIYKKGDKWWCGETVGGSSAAFKTTDLFSKSGGWHYSVGGASTQDETIQFLPLTPTSCILQPSILITSTGPANSIRPDYLGSFTIVKDVYSAGRPVWRNTKGKVLKINSGYTQFTVRDDMTSDGAYVGSASGPTCPTDTQAGHSDRDGYNAWRYWDGGKWVEDDTIRVMAQ